MFQYALKVALSAVVIVAVAEIAKRSSLWAAALASLPLTSILAFVWMQLDGEPPSRIASLANDILWLVIPSLLLFIVLPVLLRAGWAFWPSLLLACLATVAGYGTVMWLLARSGSGP
ncbi:DUF3147 family protein [Quisquiliibacterium transsilvanicum]|uniref:DUF3147 family protein n=1 Tax=Quisquiliibacterium transsilvanicum TaxID=1549638 RepID=A0A7W8HHA0_9BURK|nr:DUF3147 family protein [Quisquiliibacterium transsilvanicum]MBB5271908.1 hypothetical protein [Quisquiliibacterium transsilvanicum]